MPDWLGGGSGERLYRTGDVGRYVGDGRLEYLGRVDQQVKVRGYRIELGEIEAAMKEAEWVEDAAAAVVGGERGEKRLVGYVVMREGRKIEREEMRRHLKERLPEYMVPTAYVELEELPLTANGKLDRKALPAPAAEIPGEGEAGAAENVIEELVGGIFSEVLGQAEVSVEANFFELGGHSLLATQVVSRVREVLGVEVPLRVVFEQPTVRGLAAAVQQQQRQGMSVAATPIERASRERELPLSFAQQRLWFIHQLEPASAAYNIPMAVRLTGELNVAAFEQSLGEIERRHEVLRTRFELRQQQAVQVIEAEARVRLRLWELGQLPAEEREAAAREVVRDESSRGFDLRGGPVLRAALLRLQEDEHILIVVMHHIASDGWSTGVLVSEFSRLYEAYSQGQPSALEELRIQYADYAVWQRQYLQGAVLDEQLSYWRRQLAEVAVLELPTDRVRPAVASHRGGSVGLRLSAELTQELRRLSRQQGVTLFMTLLAAFKLLLSRYSGQKDISVATLIANRHRLEIERLIGFFINQLVLRTDMSGNPSVTELLGRVREITLGGYAYQDLPFEKLVEELAPERDPGRFPFSPVLFLTQAELRGNSQVANLKLSPMGHSIGLIRFDLELTMTHTEEGIQASLAYCSDLFDPTSALRLLSHLSLLLSAFASGHPGPAADLPMLSPAEAWQLTAEWNDTARPYPRHRCLNHLFWQQASAAPDAIAASRAALQLSYAGLALRAQLLADRLRQQGVTAEQPVAVLCERGLELLVAMLGLWQSGGVYVP
ncbi:MAG TPA: condensation domain-containing protein, partial [Blastocatellia bacterium]|nr:condensation domain-containing protein [Blastocatellia bacterium]